MNSKASSLQRPHFNPADTRVSPKETTSGATGENSFRSGVEIADSNLSSFREVSDEGRTKPEINTSLTQIAKNVSLALILDE